MVESITAEELQSAMLSGNVEVIYVLKEKQYDKMHIKGSKNIPLDVLQESAWKDLDKNKTYVVYCYDYDCQASPKAAKFLEDKGFRVLDYEGGIYEWVEKGLPTEGTQSREEFLE